MPLVADPVALDLAPVAADVTALDPISTGPPMRPRSAARKPLRTLMQPRVAAQRSNLLSANWSSAELPLRAFLFEAGVGPIELPQDHVAGETIMPNPGWTLIIIGALIVLIGVVWLVGPSIPWLGRLPGDIQVERENFRFYFPLTTCLLLRTCFENQFSDLASRRDISPIMVM
jgi:hypothetical protein